jgi:hypothetical protein
MARNGTIHEADEELDREMYHYAVDKLESWGFRHYEISNGAKDGFPCRHNLKYWSMEEYLGLGLGAHSFLEGTRFSNKTDLNEYISTGGLFDDRGYAAAGTGGLQMEGEESPFIAQRHRNTREDNISEYLFTGLRKIQGIELLDFKEKFGEELEAIHGEVLKKSLENGLMEITGGRLRFTNRGLDISNTVLRSLFNIERSADMEKYVMSLDQGTTSSRCILFNKKGEAVSVAQKEFKQIYPKPGWVEHDAMEIWSTQIEVAREAMKKINAGFQNIAAIGITNQRETTVIWDRKTGVPICNAIVWQCRRTADYCDLLKEKGLSDIIRSKTGLPIDAYFSATKIRWILENVEGARERAENGELLFGTIETWLIWRLTSGKVHITDYSNASRTMLFNIKTLEWDPEILNELEIPRCILPEIRSSSEVYGMTDSAIFGGEIPIGGAAGVSRLHYSVRPVSMREKRRIPMGRDAFC